MPVTTVKGRRVTEPTPVIQCPYQLDDNEPLSGLASAWNNITEAKTALYRAEARLEQSENTSLKDQRPILTSQLKHRHLPGATLPVDSVPSMEITPKLALEVTLGPKRLDHQEDRPRKRVTIKDDIHEDRRPHVSPTDINRSVLPLQRDNLLTGLSKDTATTDGTMDSSFISNRGISSTALTELPGASSSLDILGNGPANLSVDNTTDIRVLNDNLAPSLVRQSSTIEVSPGLRVSKDYIPAYDRLYGDKRVLNLSKRDSMAQNIPATLENRKHLNLITSTKKPHYQTTHDHMERLRDRIQQQKMSALRIQNQSTDNLRKRHNESDPVIVNSEQDRNYFNGIDVTPKVPVRKIACVPSAPAYKGFNQVETRYQGPDGRIVVEDQVKRKKSLQDVRNREQVPVSSQFRTGVANKSKPLQPSSRQLQDNQGNTRAYSGQQKPVRKVRKAPPPNAKAKKPEPDASISASAWREGQKKVLKILGPPPKQHSQLPQKKDTVSDEAQDSPVIPDTVKDRSDDEIDKLSQHPIESDNESHPPDTQPNDINHLPEEAQEILNDLHMDGSDNERESLQSPSDSKLGKVSNNVSQLSRKKKLSKTKSKEATTSSASVQKVRHYATDEVQQYMAKQRADRRKKMQEDKKQKALQAEKKKEQLQDLYKRQRETAKTASKCLPSTAAPALHNQTPLDATFSKSSGMSRPQQNMPILQHRYHHIHYPSHRRLNVSGSDKENHAFWSTSSSDSSLRSSPQTDLSTSQEPHQSSATGSAIPETHQSDVGGESVDGRRDIVLEPLIEEQVPSMMIRNKLDDKGQEAGGSQPNTLPVANFQKPVARQPRGNAADRIAAIRATAAALQGRLENEVKQLTGDLNNIAANILSSSPPNQGSTKLPSNERWAYPSPGSLRVSPAPAPPLMLGTGVPSQVLKPCVRFNTSNSLTSDKSPPPKLTKHQKVTGADQDYNVFVGFLPGVTNLNQHALAGEESQAKSDAARTIQAAFRGHQVRQTMKWELPSGKTLAHQIQENKEGATIPQVHLSTVNRPSPHSSFSNQDGLQSDGEPLSEGPISDESSEAEVDQEYTPKFKSLPSRVQTGFPSSHDGRQTNINFGAGLRDHEPHRDGLSVIDIYMKRYQESQKEMQNRQQLVGVPTQRNKSPTHHSYTEDFTGGSQPSSIMASLQDYSRTRKSPIPSSASADNISEIVATLARQSPKDSNIGRPPTSRSLSVPSPGRDGSHSTLDSYKSLGVSERKWSRTPSPRHHTVRDAGTQTPTSSASSPTSIKSRSTGSRGSLSPHSDTRSPVSDHKSPVEEIRSLIEDLKKSTSSADPIPNESARNGMSSKSMQGQEEDVRLAQGEDPSQSPSRTPRESPTSPQQGQHGASSFLGSGSNCKSPVTREVLSHFKPISHPGSETSSRSLVADRTGSSSSTATSAIFQPGPKYFSPSALQLKMAAELNLLEILEESVRQVSEVERSRAVALAHQESSSLAKILQSRQRDHDNEMQMLSLKAKQEVDSANQQLEDIKQKTAAASLEVDKVLVQARKEAAADTRDSAHRLLQTQADAAKTTAEAARQLAEAHKASVLMPPPASLPQMDAGQVAVETAKAAASAAVTAALEQQRLNNRDILQEMRALQPPPPVTRSVAAGDSHISSASPSRSTDNNTSSVSYTDDFTKNTSASSHIPTSAPQSPVESLSSPLINAAGDSSLSRPSDSSKSIKTASDISINHSRTDHSDSIATVSDLSLDKGQNKSGSTSSVRTDSAVKVASSNDSVSEVVGTKSVLSHQYSSNSFEESESDHSSLRSVISPSPSPRKPDGKKDSRSAPRHGMIRTGASTTKELQDSVVTEKDESLSALKIEMIQKQLKEEETRAQQQVTLLKLREKVLVDKTNAEVEWLEHQKRRQKEKGDEEGVVSLRKRQRALLTRLQSEQGEIKRLLSAQKQSTYERQRLLHQQEEIARLRKAAISYKDQMRDLPSISPSTSSINAAGSDDDDNVEVDDRLQSSPDSVPDASPVSSSPGLPGTSLDVSAMEKQANVMQKLKMMQQPLSIKLLMKREMKLKRRRKTVEELMAFKQRLDEEEQRVVSMEHEVLHMWEGSKVKGKVMTSMQERSEGDTKGEQDSSVASSVPHDAMSLGEHSDEYLLQSDVPSASVSSRTKSESQRSSIRSASAERSSSVSVAEERDSKNSSISEDIAKSENTSTAKGVSESPQHAGDLSSDDTIKEASALQEYGSDSFDSPADHTLTPSKSASQSVTTGLPTSTSQSASPQDLVVQPTSSTPKPASSGGHRSPFIPRQRSRHPSDSGSESEKSFSQTMSETASDQSDIEGRVRALKDALKRRKMEADRLRKQQKRMNREKLKAQEASLKKQLESYDNIIATTKAELEQESQKQKVKGSSQPQLLTPSAKPQIKQPKIGTDSLRHARALRQRTGSDSSQDGLSEGRSVVSSIRARSGSDRGRSGSESGQSSRSSLEGVREEKARDVPVENRDLPNSSFSAASSPGTHHSESPRSPHSLSRDRSVSGGSSIAEDISIRSDYSDRENTHGSDKFDSEDHRRIKEKLQNEAVVDERENDETRISLSPIIGRRLSGDGRDADESIQTVGVTVSPIVSDKHVPQTDRDDDISISSSVPEEVISAASTHTQDSGEDIKSPLASDLSKSEQKLSIDDKDESVMGLLLSPVRSSRADHHPATSNLDDASQHSIKSMSSSVHSKSSSKTSSRSQSVRLGSSYSEDFIESSVTSKDKESRTDTDEDICEELSEASEISVAKSIHSQSSEVLMFDLKEKPDAENVLSERIELERPESEIVLSESKDKSERTSQNDAEEERSKLDDVFGLDMTLSPRSREDVCRDEDVPVLRGFTIGQQVLIGGVQPGILRFQGSTNFASGMWAGIELDQPLGTNDGSIQGVSYFSCRPNYGIFAPVDKVQHVVSEQPAESAEMDLSDESSVEEDIPSESSVRLVSDKSRSLANERMSKSAEEVDEKESEISVSQITSIKSEDILEGATDDDMSEGGIDDDALEKLISNAAEAVESFSHDEPGYIHTAFDTPRGAPDEQSPDIEELPCEDFEEKEVEEARIVDSITEHLTEIVVRDTLDAMLEVATKQKQDEEQEALQESKDSLLKLLVSAESPRSEDEVERDERTHRYQQDSQEIAQKKVDSLTRTLMNDAISEIFKLRKERNAKIRKENNLHEMKEREITMPQEVKTPEDSLSPELRAETPYTPDKSPPERRIDGASPLGDDIFINRVHVESSFGSENIPVARPGSPVFGESGTVSPDALSEKLQQLQLDKDILEADLFGDEEWFDDEFGSMKKSHSIIKVPERSVSPPKGKAETPEATVAAKKQAKLDLKKIVEEPFYAVPHNVKEVKDLAHRSVTVFHNKVLNKEPTTELTPPSHMMGSDTKGSDIESTSRKAYKNLVFALSGEVYQAISSEHEPTVQPPWVKPKRKPRRFFFQQPPRDISGMTSAVEDRVLSLTGLIKKPRHETALSGSRLSKKKDHVDEILIDELKEEEPEWIDYDNDELSVKMQLSDALFESLLVDTAMVLHQIEDKRKARRCNEEDV